MNDVSNNYTIELQAQEFVLKNKACINETKGIIT